MTEPSDRSSAAADIGIDRMTFERLARAMRRFGPIALSAVDPAGKTMLGKWRPARGETDAWREICRFTISEALRWGEPTVNYGVGQRLVWAVPLMHNAHVTGGLIASVAEADLFPGESHAPSIDIRLATDELRRLAEQDNLTNAALLQARREDAHREKQRAEAIHAYKLQHRYNLHRIYLRDEPRLIAAIRKGDLGEARSILNELLVALLHYAGDRLDLTKSLLMELTVTMCRTAVEVGGEPQQLLGANYASLTELSQIDNDEQLARWLHEILDRIMRLIHQRGANADAVLIAGALQYMSDHLGEDLSRDRVAKVVHLSPSHFSRLFKRHMGDSFTDVLTRLRVDRAAELLARTDKDLGQVAMAVGFADQSYFTKVFKRHTGSTPRLYRRRHRPDR